MAGAVPVFKTFASHMNDAIFDLLTLACNEMTLDETMGMEQEPQWLELLGRADPQLVEQALHELFDSRGGYEAYTEESTIGG